MRHYPDVSLIHDSSAEYYKIAMLSLEQLAHLEVKISVVQPIIVNFSFAIELMLKTLYYKEKNRYRNIHHFDRLYDSLSEKSQEVIKTVYPFHLEEACGVKKFLLYNMDITKGSEKQEQINYDPNNFQEVLKIHSKSFQNWRYMFEIPNQSTSHLFDMRAMAAFYKAIRARFYQLQFSITPKFL